MILLTIIGGDKFSQTIMVRWFKYMSNIRPLRLILATAQTPLSPSLSISSSPSASPSSSPSPPLPLGFDTTIQDPSEYDLVSQLMNLLIPFTCLLKLMIAKGNCKVSVVWHIFFFTDNNVVKTGLMCCQLVLSVYYI